MEANKEDAVKCLQKAKEAHRNGDFEKAKRLAEKSKRLFEMKETEDFITQLSSKEDSSNSTRSHTSRPSPTPEPKQEEPAAKESTPEFTPQQKEAVEKVLKCKDYYELLGVSKDFTESELKKQYKKLALQFHPDKNNAPKADEAFKRISKAYHVLSDSDKRDSYERYGEEGSNQQTQGGYYYEDNFEFDLFRQMFGGDSPFGSTMFFYGPGGGIYNVRRRRNHYHNHHSPHSHHEQIMQQRGSSIFLLLFCIPIFMMAISYIFTPTAPYMLYRTSSYQVKREFDKNDIVLAYYVQRSFNTDYPRNSQKKQIEQMVLRDYTDQLNEQCSNELFWSRRKNKELPNSCKRLEKITGRKIKR